MVILETILIGCRQGVDRVSIGYPQGVGMVSTRCRQGVGRVTIGYEKTPPDFRISMRIISGALVVNWPSFIKIAAMLII